MNWPKGSSIRLLSAFIVAACHAGRNGIEPNANQVDAMCGTYVRSGNFFGESLALLANRFKYESWSCVGQTRWEGTWIWDAGAIRLMPAKGEILSWEGVHELDLSPTDATAWLETSYFFRQDPKTAVLIPKLERRPDGPLSAEQMALVRKD